MDFSLISSAFGQVFSLSTILYTFLGAAGGILIGCIPGLTATMGIALLVPFTYGVEFIPGVAMLLGIFCGNFGNLDSHSGNSFCRGNGSRRLSNEPKRSERTRFNAFAFFFFLRWNYRRSHYDFPFSDNF